MFFRSRKHNQAVDKAVRFFPVRVEEQEAPGRAHPWQLRPQWVEKPKEPGKGYWTVTPYPGLVNGIPAAVKMAFAEAPLPAQERILAEAEEANQPRPGPEVRVDVFLDEQASLKMQWRAIGSDAAPEGTATGNADTGEVRASFEPVPKFFKRLGVADANPDLLGEQAETQRYLRACDVVLNQPRLAFANEVTVGAVVDGSIISANPTFAIPPDRQPRLTATPKYVPIRDVQRRDLLAMRFIDEPFDQALIATVFALSPPFPQDTQINGGWAIYVRYQIHWNLVHATPRIEVRRELPRITFVTALGLGLANLQIGEILSQNNDYSQALLDLYQQTNLRGTFYAV